MSETLGLIIIVKRIFLSPPPRGYLYDIIIDVNTAGKKEVWERVSSGRFVLR